MRGRWLMGRNMGREFSFIPMEFVIKVIGLWIRWMELDHFFILPVSLIIEESGRRELFMGEAFSSIRNLRKLWEVTISEILVKLVENGKYFKELSNRTRKKGRDC